MNLEPVINYLAANGVGTKGEDLFARYLPEAIDEGVVVVTNAPIRIHPYQKGRRDGTMQVIVRGKTYDGIQAKAELISALFHTEGLDLTQFKLLQITPQHEPLIYPRAEGSLLEASVNFNITYVE